MKAGHEEEYADGTSAVPWLQSNGVRPKTSPGRRSEDGEARGGAKSNTMLNPTYGFSSYLDAASSVNNVLFTHFDMSFICACLPHGITFKDASVFASRC